MDPQDSLRQEVRALADRVDGHDRDLTNVGSIARDLRQDIRDAQRMHSKKCIVLTGVLHLP